MRKIAKIAFAVGCLGLVVWGYIGCDRLKGTLNPNQQPVVEFVNVPLDSTSFNYAPIIYWNGHDPDGLVEYYSWYDDTTQGAIHGYETDSLADYVQNIPPDAWTNTAATKATIYLLTPAGDTTQHIFFIRCTDNEGATSAVKARAFFRSNEPPRRPKLSLVLVPENPAYVDFYEIEYPDTILMGDTLTQTYGGFQMLWTGDDPDDRALVTIPLQFSYLIVREPGDTIHFPGDTVQENRWTKWSATQTKTLYGLETGNYTFYLKSRDDGLTESALPAWVKFYCIRPTFQYKLLVVDENRAPIGPNDFGMADPDLIMDFHMENLREAWAIMRDYVYQDCTFVGEGVDIQVWKNRGSATSRSAIPYSFIHQFQLIWVIDDNRASLPAELAKTRAKVMMAYLKVGGMVMLTGREIFAGSYGIVGFQESFTDSNEILLRDYFNVSEGFGNKWSATDTNNIDFGGTVGALYDYPDLQVDTVKVHSLNWGGTRRYYCLPDIDWVGRNRETTTIYYYYSCSAERPNSVNNVDVEVTYSTPEACRLEPSSAYNRLLTVSRIYNKTRNVYGEFMYFIDNNSAFWASTPVEAGAWQNTDTLEVDFTYIPTTENHLKPVATVFARMQQRIDYEHYTWTGDVLFRTSLSSFPLYFIKNDIPSQESGLLPVVEFLVRQFIFFYDVRHYTYDWGG